ncbi:hypothetical protein NC652_020972 [Populus alba x Populus x berolinensis]|nr:hypothetical protein NC652_020972 [Populus alba x Populus x berolinensis]
MSSSTPNALDTYEGSSKLALVHALPLDTASSFNPINKLSPSTHANERFKFPAFLLSTLPFTTTTIKLSPNSIQQPLLRTPNPLIIIPHLLCRHLPSQPRTEYPALSTPSLNFSKSTTIPSFPTGKYVTSKPSS